MDGMYFLTAYYDGPEGAIKARQFSRQRRKSQLFLFVICATIWHALAAAPYPRAIPALAFSPWGRF
jgi:hypothetical protein